MIISNLFLQILHERQSIIPSCGIHNWLFPDWLIAPQHFLVFPYLSEPLQLLLFFLLLFALRENLGELLVIFTCQGIHFVFADNCSATKRQSVHKLFRWLFWNLFRFLLGWFSCPLLSLIWPHLHFFRSYNCWLIFTIFTISLELDCVMLFTHFELFIWWIFPRFFTWKFAYFSFKCLSQG